MERQNDNAMVRAPDTIENSATLTGRSQALAKREARRQSRGHSSGWTARVTRSQKKTSAEAQTPRKAFRYQRSPRPHPRLRPPFAQKLWCKLEGSEQRQNRAPICQLPTVVVQKCLMGFTRIVCGNQPGVKTTAEIPTQPRPLRIRWWG